MPPLKMKPTIVNITGTIRVEDFPGLPNFQSIDLGDAHMSYWILYPSEPIEVEDTQSGSVQLVDRVHLVISLSSETKAPSYHRTGDVTTDTDRMVSVIKDAQQEATNAYDPYRYLLGKDVVVTGTLFESSTMHHHTPVLLDVSDIHDV